MAYTYVWHVFHPIDQDAIVLSLSRYDPLDRRHSHLERDDPSGFKWVEHRPDEQVNGIGAITMPRLFGRADAREIRRFLFALIEAVDEAIA